MLYSCISFVLEIAAVIVTKYNFIHPKIKPNYNFICSASHVSHNIPLQWKAANVANCQKNLVVFHLNSNPALDMSHFSITLSPEMKHCSESDRYARYMTPVPFSLYTYNGKFEKAYLLHPELFYKQIHKRVLCSSCLALAYIPKSIIHVSGFSFRI